MQYKKYPYLFSFLETDDFIGNEKQKEDYISYITSIQKLDKRKGGEEFLHTHHIHPTFLDGEDIDTNKVLLSWSEHKKAHQLLIKCCSNRDTKNKLIASSSRLSVKQCLSDDTRKISDMQLDETVEVYYSILIKIVSGEEKVSNDVAFCRKHYIDKYTMSIFKKFGLFYKARGGYLTWANHKFVLTREITKIAIIGKREYKLAPENNYMGRPKRITKREVTIKTKKCLGNEFDKQKEINISQTEINSLKKTPGTFAG